MTMPYYVAPEQIMKDRAEYAQKGIARGRALVASANDAGVLLVAENPSRALQRFGEIYDRMPLPEGKYTSTTSSVWRASTRGHQGSLTAATTSTFVRSPTSTPVSRTSSSPTR